MSNKLHLVMINGAPEVGKSWLALNLEDRLVGSAKIGLNDALKDVVSKITGLNLFNEKVYSDFKKQIFENGETGREWMITISESSKKYDQAVWVKRFLERAKRLCRTRGLVLCDSFGFPIEYSTLLRDENVETLNVYIDDSKMQLDGDYRQFAGDSRFDLSRHCTIRANNSNEALAKTLNAIINRGW